MGFGRNPYVPKAQAAEQKALDAQDDETRTRAYRDAAHQWDRAADREDSSAAPGGRPGSVVVPVDPRILN